MIIGLIGGSGVGKSAVAKVMEEDFDAFVIPADQIGHDIIKKGTVSYYKLVEYFGIEILSDDGEIDRGKLGKKAFVNQETKEALNSMTRPYIGEEIQRLIKEQNQRNPQRLIVVDAEGLVEANMTYLLDEVWSVYAPLPIRKKRLLEKRGFTEDRFNSIINIQKKEDYYKENSSFQIVNDSTLDNIKLQLDRKLNFGGNE